MKLHIFLASLAMSTMSLWADPILFELQVPANMAGHEFSAEEYDSNGAFIGTTQFVASAWDATTQTLTLAVTVSDTSSLGITNQTLALSEWVTQLPWSTSLGSLLGNSPSALMSYSFAVPEAMDGNTFGLMYSNGSQTWAFPSTGVSPVLWLPVGGNLENAGFFNVWFATGAAQGELGTGTLMNLTGWTFLDGNNAWQSMTGLTIPTMPVLIMLGEANEGKTFTFHTGGGSAQSVTVSGGMDFYSVGGQVGLFETFWVTDASRQRCTCCVASKAN